MKRPSQPLPTSPPTNSASMIFILPYHTLGMNKYTLLGQPYSAPDKPLDNPALLDFAQQYACQKGLTATLRG